MIVGFSKNKNFTFGNITHYDEHVHLLHAFTLQKLCRFLLKLATFDLVLKTQIDNSSSSKIVSRFSLMIHEGVKNWPELI
jgi:hypothetical protein